MTRPAHSHERECGQATVELLGGLPALLLLGLVLFQVLAVGYSAVLAGSAAEAGALALAGGGDPDAGARAAVPDGSQAEMRVASSDGTVEVALRPPSLFRSLAASLEVRAQASIAESPAATEAP